jgi:sterol desaturase/sphingolipid hydroxylase (fatty acid hydroxylase superfamily)
MISMLVAIACFIAAFILASLVEYWVHRAMHRYSDGFGKRHLDHHRRNEGQGVVWEFFDYIKGTVILIAPMFLVSLEAGLGWAAGAIAFAAFSAYAHQLSHENPVKLFWLPMPVHYVHHKYGQWHHNFGMALDIWDRIFGTYKPVEWVSEQEQRTADRTYLQLRWW